jgi:hypothetical protein
MKKPRQLGADATVATVATYCGYIYMRAPARLRDVFEIVFGCIRLQR